MRWDDIIGLDNAKRIMKEAVVYPIKVTYSNGCYSSCANKLWPFILYPAGLYPTVMSILHWESGGHNRTPSQERLLVAVVEIFSDVVILSSFDIDIHMNSL